MSDSVQPLSCLMILLLNGTSVEKEIVIIDGSSYLPVKAISETLGLEVAWDNDTRTISLSSDTEGSTDSIAEEMLDLMTENNEKLKVENDDLKALLIKNGIKVLTEDHSAVYIGDKEGDIVAMDIDEYHGAIGCIC